MNVWFPQHTKWRAFVLLCPASNWLTIACGNSATNGASDVGGQNLEGVGLATEVVSAAFLSRSCFAPRLLSFSLMPFYTALYPRAASRGTWTGVSPR